MAEDKTQTQENKTPAPIIIKRITHGGHGHHGGAWKVAYADFVTAMMAFFLLLWLLNAVPSEKLTGIASYFDPTIGLEDGQGIGFSGGKANQQIEGIKAAQEALGFQYGVPRTGAIVDVPRVGPEIREDEEENRRFAAIEGELKKTVDDDPNLQGIKEHLLFSMTPEGLELQVTDQDKDPMFAPGKAELTQHAKGVLSKVAKLVQFSPNFIAITGHTDKNLALADTNYTNWELSTDRANAARRQLIASGIAEEQISKVVGKADTEPLEANPYSAKNRRISVTLLRNSVMPYHKVSAPKELLNQN
ncbi:MAG: OmpA family protein [Proteobacteria bacterium]|nr:OmpA family protein [Pseudomonadota bacterium]